MTSSTRSTTRRLLAAVAVALTAVTASACSGGGIDAGAAAIVGDRRISVADVQTATSEVNMLSTVKQAVPQREVLGYLILEPFYVQTAVAQGAGVSEDDARQYLVDAKWVNTSTGSRTPSQATVDFVRAGLSRNSFLPRQDGSGPTVDEAIKTFEGISTRLKATHISVNPRYGSLDKNFDPQTIFPVNAATPDWLVAPAAEPTPTPAAS